MRKRRNSNSIDPTANHFALTEMNFNLLTKLVPWLDDHQKHDQKFKMAVLVRLSKIETILSQIQGCQLADFWADGKVTEQKRDEYIKEVQDRTSIASHQLGLKMVRYIYGESDETELPRKGRRKWSWWEI